MAIKGQNYYVIFAGPEQYKGRSRYISKEGDIADLKVSAARFVTFGDAQEFAEKHGIKLNDVTRYIGIEYFTKHDLEVSSLKDSWGSTS